MPIIRDLYINSLFPAIWRVDLTVKGRILSWYLLMDKEPPVGKSLNFVEDGFNNIDFSTFLSIIEVSFNFLKGV